MTKIAALTADDRLLEMLRGSGFQVTSLDEPKLAASVNGTDAPAAIVVDVRQTNAVPAGLADLKRKCPDTGMVLVLSSLEPRLMLDAMRAGVTECIGEPITPHSLDDALRRVLASGAPEPGGQAIAFVGAKGGVGTTTLAVNTAVALAKPGDGASLLIDLHVVHGDAALFLAAEPRFSVLDALENVHRVDDSSFSGLVENTKTHVHLLASSTRIPHRPTSQDRTRALLEFAARKYRFTVLDVPRTDLTTIDALDPATVIVVVTSQEVSALRSAAHAAEALGQRYGPDRVRIVVNRFDPHAALGTAEINKVMGQPVTHLIPSDYLVAVEAANTGKPIVSSNDTKLARALRSLARDVAGVRIEKPARPGGGVLARLAWRRA